MSLLETRYLHFGLYTYNKFVKFMSKFTTALNQYASTKKKKIEGETIILDFPGFFRNFGI